MESALLALPHTYRAFYGAFLSLRPVQRAAIEPLLSGRDLVLQAATASGKTEAVLAPCLERLIQQGRTWSVIYLVPTRALAQDLARRLEGIVCDRLGLILSIRTGDRKQRGGPVPDLLLTTPESLDVALGSQNPQLRGLLDRCGAVILDEAHAYAGQPRGAQLQAVLQRLQRRVGRPLQRIALSATLADPQAMIASFDLRPDAEILVFPGGPAIFPQLVQLQGDGELLALLSDLADRYGHRKLLLFTDSRSRCERLFATCNAEGRFRDRCELHYSNLSSRERGRVQARLQRHREVLCIATSTLELGIDVGDMDAVLLYGPPPSAAAFLQRIGRAGRRRGESVVWGICHGAEPSAQLLRFLGLLRLAHRGQTEVLRPRTFPSVLLQQILSCVYAHRRLSLAALQDLFPQHAELLARILPHIESQGWLRREATGLLAAGRRQVEARIALRLWSNFPREEPPFSLVVARQTLAEIPAKVAAQLSVGRRVQLSGRRLQITAIDPGERRQIDATPTEEPVQDELSWIGMRASVSWEAAAAVREVLADPEPPDGLWSRTEGMLQAERRRPVARLANGIEVYRESSDRWRYRTFLGTFGNLLLREAIRTRYPDGSAEIDSDPLGVSAPRWIDFRTLQLPLDRTALRAWAAQHRKLLEATLPLAAFYGALPEDLRVEELVTWLDDPRLLEAFARYRTSASEVIGGDQAALEPAPAILSPPSPPPSWPAKGPRPLDEVRRTLAEPPPLAFTARRRVTVAQIASWLRVDQCERFLGWSAAARPLPPPSMDTDRAAMARAHRQRVRADLAEAHTVETIAEHLPDGSSRSLEERHRASLEGIRRLAQAARASPGEVRYLAGAVLHSDRFLPGGLIGTPDLLAISWDGSALRIEPGDIRSAIEARYEHRWQVALHALLLTEHGLLDGAHPTGFLHLQRLPGDGLDPRSGFPLTPWLAAAPALLERIRALIEADPAELRWRLGGWCGSCRFAASCLREAASREEIQLLPDLDRGTHDALRREEIVGIDEAAELTDCAWGTAAGHARAVASHQVTLLPPALPALPPGPILVVEIEHDPATGLPATLHLMEVESGRPRSFPARDLPSAWGGLCSALEQRFSVDPPGWIAVYGAHQARWLRLMASRYDPERWRRLLRDPRTGEPHLLDLRRLLLDHVRLPALGAASLQAVGQILGLPPPLQQPSSPLHPVATPPDPASDRLAVLAALWRWLQGRLDPAPPVLPGPAGNDTSERASLLRFLTREHDLRRTDILTLQKLPLAERVVRCRALGPLVLEGSALDEEGNLLHCLSAEHPIGGTRLREGDFLRLAPVGLVDLQEGLPVILARRDLATDQIFVRLRGRARSPQAGRRYSLEEDLTDFSHPLLVEVVREVLEPHSHPVAEMLSHPSPALPPEEEAWAQRWLRGPGAELQPRQAEALILTFQRQIALIEGPPGTGKTWLLARIILAQLQRAQQANRPLRIAITALTHQAIDQVLVRLAPLLADLPGIRIAKLGRRTADGLIEPLQLAAELHQDRWIVLGTTGQGLRRLLRRQRPRQIFDLIVCDEASQLLLPQAWLALVHGRGRAIFVGDTKQLPPVIRGVYDDDPLAQTRSVLEHLLRCQPSVRLEQSHRLNGGLCDFPSQTWYDGTLRPAPSVARRRLVSVAPERGDVLDAILAPDPPAVLVSVPHHGRREQSPEEAGLLAGLVLRLVEGSGLGTEQIAVLSPHRSQNNLIREALAGYLGEAALPLVDTIERCQGAERDVVLFGLTASDPDRLQSRFLTDPRRFNVAITRARLKLIVVASELALSLVPHREEVLLARQHLLAFERFCAERDGRFVLTEGDLSSLP